MNGKDPMRHVRTTLFVAACLFASGLVAPAAQAQEASDSASGAETFAYGGAPSGDLLAPAPMGAYVSTEQPDYSPGQTVDVTGGGWDPGETVTLLFQPDPQTRPNSTVTATASEEGDFVNSEFLLQSEDLGTTYTITATGQSSGKTATATFNDAATDFYFAIGNGNWNTSTGVGVTNPVWKTCTNAAGTTGCLTQNVAAPTSTANTITIQSGVTVTAASNLTVDQVVVTSGAQVTVNSGVTMTSATAPVSDLDITGTVQGNGTIAEGSVSRRLSRAAVR